MATDMPARPRTWSRPLSERGLFAVVAGPLLVLYLLTATWTYPLLNDAFSNSATAWSIANEGTVYLEEYRGHEETYGFISWIVPAGDSIASKYPPGAALTAVPLSLLWPGGLSSETYLPEDIDDHWENLYPVLSEGPTTRVLVPPSATTNAGERSAYSMPIRVPPREPPRRLRCLRHVSSLPCRPGRSAIAPAVEPGSEPTARA